MNSRKRPAADPLIPVRLSKQPRLRKDLATRWVTFGSDFINLITDTVMLVAPGSASSQSKQRTAARLDAWAPSLLPSTNASPASTPPSSSSDCPSPTTSEDSQEKIATTPKPILSSSNPANGHSGPEDTPTSRPLVDDSSLDSINLSVSPNLKKFFYSNTNHPRTQHEDSFLSSSTPSLSSDAVASELELKKESPGIFSNRSKVKAWKKEPLRRNPMQRVHIFDKVHKAQVREDKARQRDEMTRELFALKRKTGFTSKFSDFKGLLAYQRHLEKIDLENPPHFPSSLGARSPQRQEKQDTEDDTTRFLRRALDSARATLSSPLPKAFSPTLEQLKRLNRIKDDEIERRIRPPIPASLPPNEDKEVSALLKKRGVISKFAREQVSDVDVSRLRPAQWLNDEIINFYGAMILARSEESKENPASDLKINGKKTKQTLLNLHYFTSFFWSKLTKEGYEKGRLAKWTKKIDIFSKDVIIMPVNHSNAHWTAAAINFRQKRIESYDSMGVSRKLVFEMLRSYVNDEHINKKKKPFDFDGWENWESDNTPQQENGYDCGVFTCQFMEAISRGEDFNFTQKNMPYFRKRMIWEIGNAKFFNG